MGRHRPLKSVPCCPADTPQGSSVGTWPRKEEIGVWPPPLFPVPSEHRAPAGCAGSTQLPRVSHTSLSPGCVLCPSPPPAPSPQALGCILYLLCFGQHPFEDGARLRILNGKYSIPADDTRYLVFHGLIRECRARGLRAGPCLSHVALGQPPGCGLSRGAPACRPGSHSAPGGGRLDSACSPLSQNHLACCGSQEPPWRGASGQGCGTLGP